MSSPSAIHVRPMTSQDLDAVMEIERSSFAMPLSREAFLRELSLPMARLRVAIESGSVVGFLNYWVVENEAHIMTIAVSPNARRSGVGSVLFESLLQEAKDFEAFHLELRVGNHGARQFYERFGFSVVGQRKSYYADNAEDALLMSRYKGSPDA